MSRSQHSLLVLCAALLAGGAAWLRPAAPEPNSPPPPSRQTTKAPAPHPRAAPPGVPAAIPDDHPRGFDRDRLMEGIATTRDETVMQLTACLFEAVTPEEKGEAADALAAHGGFEAIANLIRLAGLQASADDRRIVLEGLANLTDGEGFHALASVLAATRHPQLVEAVIVHLQRSPDPDIVETLTGLYRERNDSPSQKSQVLHAVASLTDPRFIRPLGKLAAHAPEPALAAAARQAMQTLPPPSADLE